MGAYKIEMLLFLVGFWVCGEEVVFGKWMIDVVSSLFRIRFYLISTQ